MTQNPWVKFLRENGGKGLTAIQLREKYESEKSMQGSNTSTSTSTSTSTAIDSNSTSTDTPVYRIDTEADVKTETLLEDFIEEYDIQGITAKLKNNDELTEQEEEAWKIAFEMALTENYLLTVQQLLNSHNWWLTRLEYGGKDGETFDRILSSLKRHHDLYEFLDDVLNSFNIEELCDIGMPELD